MNRCATSSFNYLATVFTMSKANSIVLFWLRLFLMIKKLDAVNALVHPAVAQHFNIWCNKQQADYILKEAAIMFESGANKILDAVICVTAPETTRIERAMKRDNTSEEKIKAIIARQLNEEDRNKRCNYLIKNDGTEPLLPQVLKIHDLLKGK